MALLVVGLVFVVVAIALLVLRPGQDKGDFTRSENEPPAEVSANVVAAPAIAEEQASPTASKPSPASAPEPADPQAAAPAEEASEAVGGIEVALDSVPSGASVYIDGKSIGLTPLSVEIDKDQPVQANLKLVGYREVDVLLSRNDGQGRTIKLTPIARKKVAAKRRKTIKPMKKKKTAPRQKSELEELL